MLEELSRFFLFMRPAFSRRAAYGWFVIVCAGFLLRQDDYGVSSIVRALALPPATYLCLLHFFHSSAWSVAGLMPLWWQWLQQADVAWRQSGRLALIGDHTKVPKDGRRMPAVATLHQDSETASKPSFFRGHHWGAIALLVRARDKYFATPLWASIHEGTESIAESAPQPKTILIVQMAQRVARTMGNAAYLILDAYFAVGPVFTTAAQEKTDDQQALVHILTRAKKNVVAYRPAPPPLEKKRGRKKRYGKKLKLMRLFDAKNKSFAFQQAVARVYHRHETIRFLVLDLLWKPTRGLLRFILVESSRGRMIIMSSDLHIAPVAAVELFCHRVSIETMFNAFKNLMSGLAYHFWSRYLCPVSRRPKKQADTVQRSLCPAKTRVTLAAIEKFANLQLLVLGTIQIIAVALPGKVALQSRCWLRTVSSQTPSEFVTRMALAQTIKNNLAAFGKDWITQLIRRKQNACGISDKKGLDKKVA